MKKSMFGNFLHLLNILSPDEENSYKEGCEEAIKVIKGEDDDD